MPSARVNTLTLSTPFWKGMTSVRGPTSGFPDIAAYEAYQTLAGGLLHLVVLGIVMGALLGAIGGLLGRALAAIWPARGHADA